MHPAVAAPLLYGNASPGGVASLPYGVPPAQPQPQTNPPSTPPPPYNGGDTISYPPLQLPQPLYPPPPSNNSVVKTVEITDAKVYDRERIKKALRNVLIFAATFSATMLLVAPIILELMETRGKAKSNLLHEEFKLALRNAKRTADDPSLKWVRRWETENVDPRVVQKIASYLYQDWVAFQNADQALKTTTASKEPPDRIAALHKERMDALERIEGWEIPLRYPDREGREGRVELIREGLHARTSVGPKVGRLITVIYHRTLAALQDVATRAGTFLDGDTMRLMQFNTERYLWASLKGRSTAPIIAALLLQPTRSNGRAEEYHTKLVILHKAGVRRFIEMAP